MPDFEMISSERIEFNNGGEFLELSINLVKDGNRSTPYLRLARGFYGSDGEPRYKKGGCTLPINREVLNELADAIKAWDISGVEKKAGDKPEDAEAPKAKGKARKAEEAEAE